MESNVQKIRSAARHLLCVIEEMGFKPWCANNPLAIACDKLDAALALPLLNCNVGTADEQQKRFDMFTEKHWHMGKTSLQWAQMPYEEGGAE